MTRSNESRDPLQGGKDKRESQKTSGNREESMTESGKDAFGSSSEARIPELADDGDDGKGRDRSAGLSDPAAGKQTSRSSGTTSLGGERKGGAAERAPGGVEGESGTS